MSCKFETTVCPLMSQLWIVPVYSTFKHYLFVVEDVLCNLVSITANFFCFVVVFYCLGIVFCYPFYMCGTDNVVLSQPKRCHYAALRLTRCCQHCLYLYDINQLAVAVLFRLLHVLAVCHYHARVCRKPFLFHLLLLLFRKAPLPWHCFLLPILHVRH